MRRMMQLWRKQRGLKQAEHFEDLSYDETDADFWRRTSAALESVRIEDDWTFVAAVDGEGAERTPPRGQLRLVA